MEFFAGMLLGIGLTLAAYGVWAEFGSATGVEKPAPPPSKPTPNEWVQTRNFLYYDGTMMPTIKEDANEQ